MPNYNAPKVTKIEFLDEMEIAIYFDGKIKVVDLSQCDLAERFPRLQQRTYFTSGVLDGGAIAWGNLHVDLDELVYFFPGVISADPSSAIGMADVWTRDHIKRFAAPTVPPNLPKDDLLAHFGATMAGLVEARLAEMNDWLDSTNTRLRDVFCTFEIGEDGEEFSTNFNASIESQVTVWTSVDRVIQGRFDSYWHTYSQRLTSIDMAQTLQNALDAFTDNFRDLKEKSNNYGHRWIEQADKAGLIIEDVKTRQTVEWFSTLSDDQIKADYFRRGNIHQKNESSE
jgi:hypothetical protein